MLPYLDYDALLAPLIARVHELETTVHRTEWLPLWAYLREYRSVGLQTPRQSGRSSWVVSQLIQRDDTAVIVPEKTRCILLGLIPPAQLDALSQRVISARELARTTDQAALPPRLIVDEATYVYGTYPGNFYGVLARHASSEHLIINLY